MKKETRNNLIFITILLALILPGAVILVKKKMQPGERPIGAPDPVRKTTGYMDPYPAETVPRLAPPLTLQWVAGLAVEPPSTPPGSPAPDTGIAWQRLTRKTSATSPQPEVGPADAPAAQRAGEQLMSPNRLFQLVSFAPRTGTLRLIVWDADTPADQLRVSLDGKPADLSAAWRVDMPKPVRHDLQEAGYVLPPERVLVVDLKTPLQGQIKIDAGPRTDTLPLTDATTLP
jgi:hypothetical protein